MLWWIVLRCFEERYLMNREAVSQGKPLVECAMYDLEAHIYTVVPGKSACLACLYPDKRPRGDANSLSSAPFRVWSGVWAAMEAIKLLVGLGDVLTNRMVTADLRTMRFRELKLQRRSDCAVCGG